MVEKVGGTKLKSWALFSYIYNFEKKKKG
jgi:hypothetical protein